MFDHLDHLSDFARQSLALGLYRMLTGDWYKLSVLDKALRLARPNLLYTREAAYNALRLHNTADFAAMPGELYGHVVAETLALVAGHDLAGDDLLKNLAVAAGLPPEHAPRLQDLSAEAREHAAEVSTLAHAAV